MSTINYWQLSKNSLQGKVLFTLCIKYWQLYVEQHILNLGLSLHEEKKKMLPTGRCQSVEVLSHCARQRVLTRVDARSENAPWWGVYTIKLTSSNLRVFWVYFLEVCWTFAGSCKHPISQTAPSWCQSDLNCRLTGITIAMVWPCNVTIF